MQRFYLILLLSLLLFTCYSCGNNNENEELITCIETYARQYPDGFTLDIITLRPVREGYAVEYSLSDTSLPYVVAHALAHDKVVGGWLDPETNVFAYGSTRVYPENQFTEAVAFGLSNNQKAIYDLRKDSTIYLVFGRP